MGNLLFYTVVGAMISMVAQALGASLAMNLALSLIAPPALLLVYRIYNGR